MKPIGGNKYITHLTEELEYSRFNKSKFRIVIEDEDTGEKKIKIGVDKYVVSNEDGIGQCYILYYSRPNIEFATVNRNEFIRVALPYKKCKLLNPLASVQVLMVDYKFYKSLELEKNSWTLT